jgi:methionyl aminopeptidase
MISLKSRAELEKMRHASEIVAEAMDAVTGAVRPGVTTAELDRIAFDVVRDRGARPSFKGYTPSKQQPPFPGTICASINEELVHGIPGKRVLKEGDILSIDMGAIWEGYHGDAALTMPVGEIPETTRRLLDVTQASLYAGIAEARAGNHLGDISAAIQSIIEGGGYGVVQEYGGHGVGRRLHEEPHVSNHGLPGRGPLLSPGMTVALEPMATEGSRETTVRRDRWTVATADGGLCAHFEHTICITAGAAEILTVFPRRVYERIGGELPAHVRPALVEVAG